MGATATPEGLFICTAVAGAVPVMAVLPLAALMPAMVEMVPVDWVTRRMASLPESAM